MRLRLLPLALIAALAVVAFAGAGTASARACRSADYPGSGYFTSLTVRNTSCAKGREVQREHYRCRVRNGGRDGRCNRRVEGFRCREERPASGRTSEQYNARVRCTRGSRLVKFTYQQNL